MRILAMDLGTKSLGLAVSDKTNTLATPLETIHFDFEDYNSLIPIVGDIIEKYNITTLVLGLPKNMDNSIGFASERSINFKKMLDDSFNMNTILIDERLTTLEAENILINNDLRRNKRKEIIDSVAAMLILETYLKGEYNEGK